MPNPLLPFLDRPEHPRDSKTPYRTGTAHVRQRPPEAIFLAMRRMRAPIITLLLVITVSVAGFVLIPGVDEAGAPVRMTAFEAFYFVVYTAATIGYGEITPFTTAQRMWASASILALVVGWAYTLGVLLALLQSQTFQEAMHSSRFRRRVRRLKEPFVIVVGYGSAGSQVCHGLDAEGIRCVVLDKVPHRIAELSGAQVYADSPGLVADGSDYGALTAAGLRHPLCTAVVAVTDDDDANLAVAVSASSLRPDVQVIARSVARLTTARLSNFQPTVIINASDRFGEYLLLGMRRPHVYQLVAWLMSPEDTPLPRRPSKLEDGRWLVCGKGGFARHVTADLTAAGLDARVTDPDDIPDLGDAAGVVAGTPSDTVNLAIAEHARSVDPDVFIAVRQRTGVHLDVLRAIGADALFVPTDLIAAESLARLVTPVFWSFVEHAFTQDDAWGERVLTALQEACGARAPRRELVTVSNRDAPALVRALATRPVTIGDLLHDPDDYDLRIRAYPLQLVRGEVVIQVPALDEPLREGDQLLLVGHDRALGRLLHTLDNDTELAYVTTGERIPSTWLWKAWANHRAKRSTC